MENEADTIKTTAAEEVTEVQPAQAAEPQKPKKLKRHFWLWPLLIGLALTYAGQIIGYYRVLTFMTSPVLSASWKFTAQYALFMGIVVLTLTYCYFFDKSLFHAFMPAKKGGLKGNTFKEFALGIGIGFLMNGGCIFLAWLHGDLHFAMNAFDPIYLIVTFLCVCIQSSAEEMVTRGYIYHAHADRYPIWFAIAANSILFGCLHLGNSGITVMSFLQIVFCGVAFSLLVYARKSLWMAYAVHTMWNFTQSILFGLPNSGIVSEGSLLKLEAASGSAMFYDTAFGIEGSIMSVIAELLLCAWAIWIVIRDKKRAAAQA